MYVISFLIVVNCRFFITLSYFFYFFYFFLLSLIFFFVFFISNFLFILRGSELGQEKCSSFSVECRKRFIMVIFSS